MSSTLRNKGDAATEDVLVKSSSPNAGFEESDEFAGPVREITASRGWVSLHLRELWQSRELLYFLAWRDIKVRYKQTILGAAWAIIQPFFTMVVFSLFFGNLAKMPSEGIPYPIFSYAALVPWTYFSTAMSNAANALVGNAPIIQKVYFPRLAVPIAGVLSPLVDFVLAFLVLIAMMFYFHMGPSVAIVWLPVFLLLAFVTALGVGLWMSALNVEYRDVRYVVPFLINAWLFLSPVAYPSTLLKEPWHTLYGLNPMAGVCDGFRWALFGGRTPPPGPMVWVSALAALLILVTGAYYFRRMEHTFADVV
ncbi:MAG: ABC transporter permease [Anaerolineales bacterium]|jgi:lipopolysaccharide transport system permease protein